LQAGGATISRSELKSLTQNPEAARHWTALLQKLTTFISTQNHEDLIVLTELIEAGKITPVIDRTYPLSEAPKAIRYLEQGHARGKIVITI